MVFRSRPRLSYPSRPWYMFPQCRRTVSCSRPDCFPVPLSAQLLPSHPDVCKQFLPSILFTTGFLVFPILSWMDATGLLLNLASDNVVTVVVCALNLSFYPTKSAVPPIMCRAMSIQNEKVDTFRRIPPISSNHFDIVNYWYTLCKFG